MDLRPTALAILLAAALAAVLYRLFFLLARRFADPALAHAN